MRVLWITNAPFPEVANELSIQDVSKGWVYSSANEIAKYHKDVQISVVSFYPGNKLKKLTVGLYTYFLLPKKVQVNGLNTKYDRFWKQIHKEFAPDVVHIHGSEYPYSYSYGKACGFQNIVVSVQGLVSVIERYYLGGIKKSELYKRITLWDVLRSNSVFARRKALKKRGEIEKLLFQNISYSIGRTTWDYLHVRTMNPKINYYTCEETLRTSFYENTWNFDTCEKYSIFISQANYPLKGFHQLIKALPYVLEKYPETRVYVAGNDVFRKTGYRKYGYGQYINALISRNRLNDNITFVGFLSESEMQKRYCKSHVFVSPSSIENSSNSIGEAQILGVPVVASYVGGTPDHISHGETGFLYRFEEFEMLAGYICNIFDDKSVALRLSEMSKISASQRHNRIQNANTLYKIYSEIIKKNCKASSIADERLILTS